MRKLVSLFFVVAFSGFLFYLLAANSILFVKAAVPSGVSYVESTVWDGTTASFGYEAASDDAGNLVVTGIATGTIDVDPTEAVATVAPQTNGMFIQKYGPGKAFEWVHVIAGAGSEQPFSATIDKDGNIYVVGWFSGTLDFNPDGGDVRSGSGRTGFITSYESDGSYRWTHTFPASGSGGDIEITDVEADHNGNVFITGFTYLDLSTSAIDFDPTAGEDILIRGSLPQKIVYVSKFGSDSSYSWTKYFTSNDEATIQRGLAIDSSGNLYISTFAGWSGGTFDLDPGPATVNVSVPGGILVKLNNDGIYQWGYGLPAGAGWLAFEVIEMDKNDNLFLSGMIWGATYDFDFKAGTHNLSTSPESTFIASYDSDANIRWAYKTGGYEAGDMALTPTGDVYALGIYEGTKNFDGTGGTDNYTSSYGKDKFIVKYSNTGSYLGALTLWGSNNYESIGVVDSYPQGITVAGNYLFHSGYIGLAASAELDGTATEDIYTQASARERGFLTQYLDASFDATPPQVTIVPLSPEPTTETTPTISGTAVDADSTVASVSFQVDSTSGTWSACSADDGTFDEASEEFSCEITDELASGEHTIYLRATDSEGNTTSSGQEASYTFSVESDAEPTPDPGDGGGGDSGSTSSSTSSGTSEPNLPPPPDKIPVIYQIDTTQTEATIYFVPSDSNASKYVISYGLDETANNYAVEFKENQTSGAIAYTIRDLQPNTEYFFKVMAANGRGNSKWSEVKSATTISYGAVGNLPPVVSDPFDETEPTDPGDGLIDPAESPDPSDSSDPTDTTDPTEIGGNEPDPCYEFIEEEDTAGDESLWQKVKGWFKNLVDGAMDLIWPERNKDEADVPPGQAKKIQVPCPTASPEPIVEPIETSEPPALIEEPTDVTDEATESAELSDEEASESAESTESAVVAEPPMDEPPQDQNIIERVAETIVSSPPAAIIRETAEAAGQTPAVQAAQETIVALRQEPAAQTAAVAATGTVVTTVTISSLLIAIDRTVKVAQASATIFKTASTYAGSGVGLAALLQYLISIFSHTVPIAFIDRKRKKTLGVVLDTHKGLGLKAAYVMFFTKDGQLKSAITNRDGRYSLRLATGNYQIRAEKAGFEMADLLTLRSLEKEYSNVYYPNTDLSFKENSFANVAIGLKEKALKSSEIKMLTSVADAISSFISRHFVILTLISLLMTASSQIISPNPINTAVLYLILISVMLKISQKVIDGKTYGTIKDKSGKPLAGIRVELHKQENNGSQFYSATETDEKGRYQLAPENGSYTFKVINHQGQAAHTKTVQVTDKFPLINAVVSIG